ncbi:MAG: hypothetical protein HQL84_01635 [Magnetococcales bacterium]|nr:hypothetical protein [Magnetococcales bacterium]MBF0148728.1 hypothetical protein [Magnetococcales bacterium]
MREKKKEWERIEGTVLNVQTMLNSHGRSTITLHVDNRYVAIEFFLSHPKGDEIREGDRVVVIGHANDEWFLATAYHNLTRGTSATGLMIRRFLYFSIGSMTLALGLLFAVMAGWKGPLIRYSNEELAIAAIMFFFVSMIFTLRGRLMKRAWNMAMQFSSDPGGNS